MITLEWFSSKHFGKKFVTSYQRIRPYFMGYNSANISPINKEHVFFYWVLSSNSFFLFLFSCIIFIINNYKLRFGTQIQGNGLIKRNLKIQNLSWIPIEINWKIFIVEPNDKKLVDVNVLFDDITEADLIKLANSQQNKPNTSQSILKKKKKKIF